jgi:enamine deaminase RidA (YjgF/YER057c/UK114 family)
MTRSRKSDEYGFGIGPPKSNQRRQTRSLTTLWESSRFKTSGKCSKIKSGKILWLAGTTALPVYHDHPHKRDQIQQYLVNDLEAQTRAAMDGIKQTLDAAGASFKDVVHYFVFRA